MAREVFAPLMKEFLRRFPGLRMEMETYASGWDQEPREDVDVWARAGVWRLTSQPMHPRSKPVIGRACNPCWRRRTAVKMVQ